MIKKIIIIQLLTVFLCTQCTVHLQSKNEADNRAYWNNRISTAPNISEKFNILGEKIVEDIRKRVDDIIDKKKWEEYRLFNKKINLLVSLRKIRQKELKEFRDGDMVPLEKVFDVKNGFTIKNCLDLYAYDLLSGSLKAAIEKDTKLKDYITILCVETESLKEAIMETEDPVYNQTGRLKFGEMQALNANYYCVFKILKKSGKFIFNGGHANLIEKGIEIGNTANFEFTATELFDECKPELTTPTTFLPNPGMFNTLSFDQGARVNPVSIIPETLYRPGPDNNWQTIAPGSKVQDGGEISFALDLKRKEGYLLIFLMDNRGKAVNLFPGTNKALKNKRYRVPDDLYNPTTEVLRDSAAGTKTCFGELDTGKVQTAVYTFDNKPGKETFYFYFAQQTDAQLEEFLSKAADTGKDIDEIKTKGVKNQSKTFAKGKEGKTPGGEYFLNAFKLNLEHE